MEEPNVNRSCSQVSNADAVELLNRDCHCISVDEDALRRELEVELGAHGVSGSLVNTHPHLFASLPVFLSHRHVEAMASVIAAVESVVGMQAYKTAVLQWAPEIAGFDPGPRGVFYGYDFHLHPDGPRLIEINTNAGGALLNIVLARAQRACCAAMDGLIPDRTALQRLENAIVSMFHNEWRMQRGVESLRVVAIVDDEPSSQFLYPEFLLFQQLFRRAGIEALIVDPADLVLRGDGLWRGKERIDLVYNRLTDFSLELPQHAPLRDAYLGRQIVMTPHPRAHALYADKRNLALLTDQTQLKEWDVSQDTAETLLGGIASTRIVQSEHAATLWSERRKLFFKPATGYGSKAAYRGDKITRRAWDEVMAGHYVAQAYVPPSERVVRDAASPIALKLDVRNYVYNGAVQFMAARLYQGQTTNFRTPQGGFATVFHPTNE